MFNGERSTSTRKDEFPDLCGSGFNYLQKARISKPFKLPKVKTKTMLNKFNSKR